MIDAGDGVDCYLINLSRIAHASHHLLTAKAGIPPARACI